MPGKSISPDLLAEALTLREAGYTTTSIAQRTGISLRTLARLFERHHARKGSVKAELVDEARKQLVEAITSGERVREQAAQLVADDLAHTLLLRQRMAEAADHLRADNLPEAALLMRACAAWAVALKSSSDVMRHSLRVERALEAGDAQDVPELVVREVTVAEALQLRKSEADGLDAPDAPAAGEIASASASGVSAESERVEEGDDDVA